MTTTRVHIVSLGCARNDVDSEELAGRLEAGGFALVDEPEDAEAIVVNTCGFIESAKKDSIDTLLAASDLKGRGTTQRVVAVGCMAERYGRELADALPEADAVLGFDDYENVASELYPTLTTMALPHRTMGHLAATALLTRLGVIDGPAPTGVTRVECPPVIRESVAPPRD